MERHPGRAAWRAAFVALAVGCATSPLAAQVVMDGTTDRPGPLTGPDYAITAELGRRAGSNLFHSFERFGLRTGESATFSGLDGVRIDNVISRVTGGERSDIDGTIASTIPGADLWFLNPAGVMFGPNARLDVRGSFHLSTADELRFADGAVFSARDPGASSLTLAAPEAFGFLGADPAGITVDRGRLAAPPGEALSLVGGDVTVTAGNNGFASRGENGTLRAEAGRITLAGAGGPGEVRLGDGRMQADAGAEVRLTGEASIDVRGEGGGTVRIRAGRFVMEGQSPILASSMGAGDGGGVAIDAEAVTITSESVVFTDALASGGGGSVVLRAGDLRLTEGGLIRSLAAASGRAGDVTVEAGRVLVDRAGSERDTGIVNQSDRLATGDAGAITLRADLLEVRGGGVISAGTGGGGRAGSVRVEAGRVLVAGAGSSIGSEATDGTGDAGTVDIRAGEMAVRAGGQVSALTETGGNGGSVAVEADRLVIAGDGTGLVTGLRGDSSGEGAAGAVTVRAGGLEVLGGGEIRSSTFAGGDGGPVTVNVEGRLLVSGAPDVPPAISSSVEPGASGAGGTVTVTAGELEVRDDGRIRSATFGTGDAGVVSVTADRISLIGGGQISSSALRPLLTGGPGSTGDAGDVTVAANEFVTITGKSATFNPDGNVFPPSGIFSTTESLNPNAGNAGTVAVTAPVIALADTGEIASESFGPGRGGTITVTAPDRLVVDAGEVTARTERSGRGGNISVVAGTIELHNGGLISSETLRGGAGGTVNVSAERIVMGDRGIITARSAGTGSAGDLVIDGGSRLEMDDARITTEARHAGGGGITIGVRDLIDLRDSRISTSVRGERGSNAGNITVDPRFLVLDGSDILARANAGAGGVIDLRFGTLFRSPDSDIDASAGPAGIDGTVRLEGPEEDVSGGLVALPATFVDASSLLPASCEARSTDTRGRFTSASRGGVPQGPGTALPGLYSTIIPDAAVLAAEADARAGRYREAVRRLAEVVPAARGAGDRSLDAALTGTLGAVQLAAGSTAEARTTLAEALGLARATGDPSLLAVTLMNVGNALAAAGGGTAEEAQPALSAYGSAAELALAADDRALAARAALNEAVLLARLGRDEAALDRASAALDGLARAPGGPTPLELVTAGVAAQGADAGVAAGLFERAADLAQRLDDARVGSYALGYLAAVKADDDRAGALRHTRRAMFLAQAADAPESLYRWQWQAGRLLADGDPAAAIEAYEGAVATLQTIRADLPAFDPQTGRSLFRETLGPVYLELADLLLRQSATDGGRPQLVRARTVVENLKSAELADYFEDECLAQLQARAAPLDLLLEEANAAVLYPIILPDRLEVLVSLPDGTFARATSRVTAEALAREADRLRLAMQNGFGASALPSARQLYAWLVAPVAPVLAGAAIETLVFVPDGALRSIPLSALHDGERYLVERYAVATAPGLSLLDPRPIARADIRPLLAGLTEAVGGFDPLPQVAEEIAEIHDLLGGTVLLDDAFSAAAVRRALERTPYTVVHIASHAQFSSDLDETFLLTHGGRLGIDELEGMLGASRFREEPVELMVLSACETAAGDDRAALGLAGVAVKAGARSALATLWQVSDEGTAVAAAEFYRQLGTGVSKAEALRRAQLALIGDPRYADPFYWAPFLVIGNWL